MENWISINTLLPPDNLIVEVKGVDAIGEYTMQVKYVRYKSPNQKQGRWMHFVSGVYWDKYPNQVEISHWRMLTRSVEGARRFGGKLPPESSLGSFPPRTSF